MQIQGTSQLHGTQAISGAHLTRTTSTESVSQSTAIADQLDISEAGQLAGQLSEIPDVRQERVETLRAAIQSGTYETEQKLSAAVDRLLDELV